jgi:transposase
VTDDACWIGIDVSKAKLDVASYPHGSSWQVDNTAAGIATLSEQLHRLAPNASCWKRTGGYECLLRVGSGGPIGVLCTSG